MGETDNLISIFDFDFTGGELLVIDSALRVSGGNDFYVFDFDLLVGVGEVGVVNEDANPIIGGAVVFVEILFDAEGFVNVERGVESWENHVARRDGGAATGSVGSEGNRSGDGSVVGGAELDLVASAIPKFADELVLSASYKAGTSDAVGNAGARRNL